MSKLDAEKSFFERDLEDAARRWLRFIPEHLQVRFLQDMVTRPVILHDNEMGVLQKHINRQAQAAGIDDLTKLVRRNAFYDHLMTLLQSTSEHDDVEAVAIIFIDLNQFKAMNDTHGHQVGDQALVVVGAILRETVRLSRSDYLDRLQPTADDAFDASAGRWGGDEFVISMHLAKPEHIDIVTSRIHTAVNDLAKQRQKGFVVSSPIQAAVGGLSFALKQPLQDHIAANTLADLLISRADLLMYRAKEERRPYIGHARLLPSVGHNNQIPDIEVAGIKALTS